MHNFSYECIISLKSQAKRGGQISNKAMFYLDESMELQDVKLKTEA